MVRMQAVLYFSIGLLIFVLIIGLMQNDAISVKNILKAHNLRKAILAKKALDARNAAIEARKQQQQLLVEPRVVKIPSDDLTATTAAKKLLKIAPEDATTAAITREAKNDSLLVPLKKYSQNNTIIITLVDLTCVNLAINLYEFSYKPLSISNYLFVCASKEACDILSRRGLNSHLEFEDPNGNKITNFFTSGYHRKVNLKLEIARRCLNLGFVTILADADIVIFKDPREYLRTFCAGKTDVCFQAETGGTVNSGFYYAKPTSGAKLLLSNTERDAAIKLKTNPSSNDQITIQGHIRNLTKFNKLVIKTMPTELFSHGLHWWDQKLRGLYPSRSKDCYMLHNNFIVSFYAKIYRFRELRFWEVNDGDYYSSEKAKYFTYNISSVAAGATGAKQRLKEINQLRKALIFGKLFKRILVLPQFHCPKNLKQLCPITNLVALHKYEACFTNNSFRESQFLSNKFVPEVIREGQQTVEAKQLDIAAPLPPTLPEIYDLYLSSDALQVPVIHISNIDYFLNDTEVKTTMDKLFPKDCYKKGFTDKLV